VNDVVVHGVAQGFAILYGLVIGSFWNVAIARMPDDQSLWPRSRCPGCGSAIAASDNVPVLSWLWLRGRCRSCGMAISPSYPLIEVLGGLLGWLLFRALVPDATFLDGPHVTAWVVYFVFFSCLVIGSFVDLRHRILPDQVTSYAVPLGLLGVAVLQWVGFDGFPHTTVRGAVIGAAFWGLSAAGVAGLGQLWQGQEVLGWGDVKLAAMLGSFLGPLHTFIAVMWGSTLGSIVGVALLIALRRRLYYAFGPPLAVGAMAYVLFGEPFAYTLFPQWNL